MIAALYMLRAMRNILHGPVPEKWTDAVDANLWRKLPYALLLASLLVFGCFPRLLTEKITPDVEKIVKLATLGKDAVVVGDAQTNGFGARPHPGPLPGGEGQGEGGCAFTTKGNQSHLALAAREPK